MKPFGPPVDARPRKKQRRRGELSPRFRRKRAPSIFQKPKPDSLLWHEREPLEAFRWAKHAYFDKVPHDVICEKTGYAAHQLKRLIFGAKHPRTSANSVATRDGWFYEQYSKNLNAVVLNKTEIIEELVLKGLGLTKSGFRALEQKIDGGEALSPDDLAKLVAATQKLHTMGKLEAGESTQNIGVRVDVTLDGIRKLFIEAKESELSFIDVPEEQFRRIEDRVRLGEK